jgi:hypothetical protein
MNPTTKLHLFLVCSTLVTLCWAQCLLNGNVELSTELLNPVGIITLNELTGGTIVISTSSTPLNVSTWEGGVELSGDSCFLFGGVTAFSTVGLTWRGNLNWYDDLSVTPGYFFAVNGASKHCTLTFNTPIMNFTVRAASPSGSGGQIVAKDSNGDTIACLTVPYVESSPTNYYDVYGIQSSSSNIKSISFQLTTMVADDVRFYGEIPAPVAEPIAEPVVAPLEAPVNEPVAAPIAEPMAAPVTAPVVEPVAAEPIVSAPVSTPSNTPNRNFVSAAVRNTIVGTIGLPILALTLLL